MPDWMWGILALAITGLFFLPVLWLHLAERRQHKEVQGFLDATPLLTGGPVPLGPVLAEGTCQPRERLTAPLSGRACPFIASER